MVITDINSAQKSRIENKLRGLHSTIAFLKPHVSDAEEKEILRLFQELADRLSADLIELENIDAGRSQ
jgi:hypothetical protein